MINKIKVISVCTFLLLNTLLTSQSITNYTTVDGLPSDVVNCITQDPFGSIWVGTNNGFAEFNGEEWIAYEPGSIANLPDENITAIHYDEELGLWIGTDFGLANCNSSDCVVYSTAEGLANNRISSIESNDLGIFAGHRSGFSWINLNNEIVNYGEDIQLPFGGVSSISVLDEDIVLGLGLNGVALYELGGDFLIIIGEDEGLINNRVKHVEIDEVREEIWVATDGGLSLFTGESEVEVVNFPSVFELPPPHILNQLVDVKLDSKGRVWTGVFIEYLVNVGGLSYQDEGDWITLDQDDGIVSPVVNQIEIDDEDCVWVATGGGVSRVCLDGVSTEDLKEEVALDLAPNPAGDFLYIGHNKNISQSYFEIYNLQGQSVLSGNLNAGTTNKIDIKSLSSGTYIINMNALTAQFIKH